MSVDRLDCRGLACPNPVLRTKEAIDRGGVTRLEVLVDNAAAKENVSRFMGRFGFAVTALEEAGIFTVTGEKTGEATETAAEAESCECAVHKTLVLIGTDRMGKGDDELGGKLIVNFVATLKEMGSELWQLVLLNGGVKLAIEGSASLAAIQELEKDGTRVLVCGTCLNFFDILDQKRVGETTNMLDIVTAMQLAEKVITVM